MRNFAPLLIALAILSSDVRDRISDTADTARDILLICMLLEPPKPPKPPVDRNKRK